LREQENASLVVRDVTGRQVSNLTRGTMKSGIHEVTWDAIQVSAGVYFIGFRAGEFRQTHRLMLPGSPAHHKLGFLSLSQPFFCVVL
jgi:hypothetical protein